MTGIFSDGSFQDYFGGTDTAPQGSYGAPGVFSYGQYNQEQAMRKVNPKDLVSMQTQQMTQQKKAMEMQKMEEDRQLELAMKQAVSEASKYGPDAIASVYEQFGDAKTAMDIRKSAQGLIKGGLETKKLMLDVESAKRAAVMNQVAARISSLPANQRAQEWAALVPQINAQMGTELPEEYSSGNLMGVMAVQQGAQESLRTMLSNPQTAPLAEPALRAMADPAVDKYFNDLIAAKKASLGPDLVTRGNGNDTSVDRSIAQMDAEYQRLKEPTKLSPEMQAAQDQAQGELRQEAQAQAQELSNAMAELSAKENPTAADIARVKALAESVRAGQTPLGVPTDAPASRETSPTSNQTKTFTTKTDAKGNVSFSESVKESPEKFNKEEALAREMAGLQDSLSGLDLPPSTWEDPEKNKPLSAVGKLQYDASKAKTPEERAQLEAAAAQQAKTGGGIQLSVNNLPAASKKTIDNVQQKYLDDLDTLDTLRDVADTFDAESLTIQGKAYNGLAGLKDAWKISSPEDRKRIAASSKFLSTIQENFALAVKSISGGAVAQGEFDRLKKAFLNADLSPQQFITRYNSIVDRLQSRLERRYDVMQTGELPAPSSKPEIKEVKQNKYSGMSRQELLDEYVRQGGKLEDLP